MLLFGSTGEEIRTCHPGVADPFFFMGWMAIFFL